MKKNFRVIAGVKFYCDEKGIFLKDAEGKIEEVPETDTTASEVTVDESAETTEEVKSMLSVALRQAKASAEKTLGESSKKAVDAIVGMFDAVTKAATKSKDSLTAIEHKASFKLDEVKAGLKGLADRQRNTFSFTIKSKKDLEYLAKATSEGDLTGDVLEGERSPEVTRDPVRSVFIESIADTMPISREFMSYVECVDETGTPATTAELGTIGEKDFEFQEYKAHLKKVTITNKHSVEILKDAPQLVAAIKGWLQEDVNIVVDQQLINGNGIGDNLSGVFTVASVLDATAVGTKRVSDANLYDVIRVAITKIAVSGKGKFTATHVLLNSDDADALDLTKDENGQYILPPFRSADGTSIKGARIIENVGIPAGKFLVGDFRKLHVGTQGGVEVEMTNSDGTDFSKDILTVKLRRRLAAYVRTNDNGAFWTGDISDVIDALTAPLAS